MVGCYVSGFVVVVVCSDVIVLVVGDLGEQYVCFGM